MGLKAVSVNVAASLGYTPVNKAGDTMTGTLNITGTASNVNLSSDGALAWSSNVAGTDANDAVLYREAANTIAMRNSTNPQKIHLYNTYTDSSNYEGTTVGWASSVFRITSTKAGTGGSRGIELVSNQGVGIYTSAINRFTFLGTVFSPATNALCDLGSAALSWKRLYVDYTNTGTVGAVTINKAAGRVNIAAGGTSVVVTNSLVTAAAKVFCTIATNDATAVLKNVVPAAGSFTITLNAATTAQTAIDFFVVNAD